MSYLAVITEDDGVELCYVSFKDKIAADSALVGTPSVTSDSSLFTAGTPSLNGGTQVVNGISHSANELLSFTVTAEANSGGAIATITVDYELSSGTDGKVKYKVKRTSDPSAATDGSTTLSQGPQGEQGPAGGSTFTDPLISNPVATADGSGTGTVSSTATFIFVTSASAAYEIILPAATRGKIITGTVGANGFVLEAAATETVDHGRSSTVIPANTDFVLTCTTDGAWEVHCEIIMEVLTNVGATINSWLAAGRDVIMPGGEFYVEEPIVFNTTSGQRMVGASRNDPVNLHDATYVGNSTRLWYTYDNSLDDAPCIKLGGSEITIKDFGIYGSEPTGGAQKNGAAMVLTDLSAGLGNGKIRADGIAVFGFEVGLQLGLTDSEEHNDICEWSRLVFRNCGDAIVNKNTFAMEHTFFKCQFRHDITNSVRIHGGGHLSFRDCFIALPQTFLHFGSLTAAENNATEYRTGPNNRNLIVDNLKVDAQATATGTFKLVETSAPGHKTYIYFDRPSVGGTTTGPWSEGNIDEDMTLMITDPSYTSELVTPFTVSAVAEPV